MRYHCHIFSILTLPPPKSTLFPYTTLFRSFREVERRFADGGQRFTDAALLAGFVFTRDALDGRDGLSGVLPEPDHLAVFADRKSTRLNSSHPSISYAVFCLKKKKILMKNTY